MKHLYRIGLLFLGMFVLSNLSFGQTTHLDDNFDDGDIVGWTEGTASDWVSSTTTPINGTHSLKHNLSSVSGTSYISYALSGVDLTTEDYTWQLQLNNGSWDPSSSNKFWFYLVSNEADLTSATVDGYAVGVNLTGSSDILTLWKVTDGAADGEIIASTLDWNSSTIAGIQVTRTTGGGWELSIDSDGGFDALVSAGTGTNTDYTTFSHAGLEFAYSSSRAGLLWMDDVLIQSAAPSTNTQVQFTSASASVAEDGTSYDLTLGIINEDGSNATTVDVALTSGEAADINTYTTQTVTFAAGSATDETVTVTITDDAVYEGDETLTFTLQSVAGGNGAELGSQTTFNLTITDNDPLPAETLPYSETFDADLSGVLTFNASGATKEWEQSSGVASMNGYNSGDIEEDWLILPVINLDNYSDEIISFDSERAFGGDDANNFLKLVYSTDYPGTGDPSTSTWTELSFTGPSSDNTQTNSGIIDISAVSGTTVYFAFQYRYESGSYTGWEIDNIAIEENPVLPEPTNHVASFAASVRGSGNIDLSWVDNDGAQAAEMFLIKASTVSAGDIADPVDGTAEADDALVVNVASGAGSYTFERLTPETQYFFKIYPYTNNGSNIDFKTDGTVPEANGTTGALPEVLITELADPDNLGTSGGRFIELFNIGSVTVDFTEGDNWRIDKYVNGGSTVTQTIDLTGSIAPGEYFIIATGSMDTDFETIYGVTPDQWDGSNDFVAGSNGDDNIELVDGTGSIVDQFGVPGEDGTGTNHEFEDGRAERVATVTGPNPIWDVAEWNIDSDAPSGDGPIDAPGGFDPGEWIGDICTAPTTQASAINFTAVGDNTITVNWTRGDGDEVIVVAKAASAVDADPEDGTSYTANAAFESGSEIGTGNFVVYTGTATSIAVTSLTQGTEYHFAAYEYNTVDDCYNLTALTGSQSTTTPNDTNSDITALASPISQTNISSLADTDAEAVDVFGFTITDEGTDGQTTSIDAMEITAGTNNTADWSTTLAGAVLTDGVTDYPMTIAAGALTLDLSGSEYVIANGTSQEFTLSVWFNTEVTDEEIIEFEIPVDNGFSSLSSGSIFLTNLVGAVTSSQHTVDVTATVFALQVSSVVGIDTDFDLSVNAEDANGNTDIAARTVSLSKTSGSGALTGTGLTGQAMTNGGYVWSALQLDAADNYVLTIDDDGSALTATANVEAAQIMGDLFISEYIEGTSSDDRAIEIYNGTGITIDLSDYSVKQARNGNGFGNDAPAIAYELPLSGMLATGEVFVIANASAVAEILNEADVVETYGDTEGDRIAEFTGNDAIGLFKNNVLIDVVGDPDNNTGPWDVAGITGATENKTLVRKGSVSEGNAVALSSFGMNETDSEWIVNDVDDFSNIGFHLLDGEVLPRITVDTESFNGAFGFIVLGQSSEASSYIIEGVDLTADVIVTPPAGFEIAAEMDFSGTIYTNASPWTITQSGGMVNQTVYVRFTPLATDVAYSGDITHTSTDAETKTVSVSGTEGVLNSAPNLSGIVINEILPDPTGSVYNYDTDNSGTFDSADEFVEIHNTSGSPVDISGWQLFDKDGMFYEFPATTTLAADSYAGVLASVSAGGTLPTPSGDNLAFEAGGSWSLTNGGDAVALFDPNSGNYIAVSYGSFNSPTVAGGTLVGIVEDWGSDTDGSSLVRESATSLTVVVHGEIQGALAASFAEPTIDPNAPQVTIDVTAFSSNFGNVLVGAGSATSSYTVAGTNLEADIVITAPDNFEVSQDGTTFSSSINLAPTANEVSTTTITVRYTASAEGSQDGTITHTSTNAVDNELDVAGAGITDATIFFEGFGSCDALNGFSAQSVIGDEVWECANFGETGTAVRMSGFNSGVQDNEDWLVTPAIDLSSVDGAQLSFDTDVQFSAIELEVYVSSDYTTDVTTATWTELDAVLDTDDGSGSWTNSGLIDLPVGGTVYVAFKYESTTAEGAASWTIDNLKVSETQPFFSVDSDGFNGDFGQQDVGTTSLSASFTVEGFGLTENVTVTPPAQFEVSTTSDFATAGTSTSPLTITVANGTVDQEVFVRFAPATAGSFSGNVTVSTTGFDNVTLAVSGLGEEDDPTLSLNDQVEITVYPNPIRDAFKISNETGKSINVEVFALDGSQMNVSKRDDVYSIASLNTGVYVLVVKDDEGNELARQQIIKE